MEDYLGRSFLPGALLSAKQRLCLWYVLIGLIAVLGIYLRYQQLIFNRSLWLDEAFLATQVARGEWRSFFHMPMEYSHIVPPFFLVLCRVFVALFGDNDLSLRLYPFTASILSIGLFYHVLRRTLSPWALLCALILFCTSQELVFYASDLKQYASDVLFTLGLYALFLSVPEPDAPDFTRQWLMFTAAGVISLGFFHPSIMILASFGVYLSYHYVRLRQWQAFTKLLLSGVLWLGTFACIYFWVNGGDPHKASPIADWLYIFWHDEHGFIPHAPGEAATWLVEALRHFFKDPLGLKNAKLATLLALFGVLVLLKKDPRLAAILVLPLAWTLLATYFEKYVFSGRLVLFLTPLACMLVAVGITHLNPLPYLQRLAPGQRFAGNLLFVVLQGYVCFVLLQRPFRTEHVIQEIKPALAYLQQHVQPTDKIYLYKWVEPAARYYAPLYGFKFADCHVIVDAHLKAGEFKEVDFFRQSQPTLKADDVNAVQCILGQAEGFVDSKAELALLQHTGKVWFVFTHISTPTEAEFLHYLDTLGTRLAEHHYPAVGLYLYQL